MRSTAPRFKRDRFLALTACCAIASAQYPTAAYTRPEEQQPPSFDSPTRRRRAVRADKQVTWFGVTPGTRRHTQLWRERRRRRQQSGEGIFFRSHERFFFFFESFDFLEPAERRFRSRKGVSQSLFKSRNVSFPRGAAPRHERPRPRSGYALRIGATGAARSSRCIDSLASRHVHSFPSRRLEAVRAFGAFGIIPRRRQRRRAISRVAAAHAATRGGGQAVRARAIERRVR